jgi:hypothetical protein
MSNSKSGFELRTDILGMAMGLLENNREQVMNAHFQLPDDVRKAEDCPIIEITTDGVIAEAKKLYEFVNEK